MCTSSYLVVSGRGRLRRVLLAIALLAPAGCSGAGQAGLANVPNPNRPWSSDDLGRDPIANGSESCARSGTPQDDPLKYRYPPCPEQAKPGGKAAALPAAGTGR